MEKFFFLSSVFPKCCVPTMSPLRVHSTDAQFWHGDFRGLQSGSPKKHFKKSLKLNDRANNVKLFSFSAKSRKLPCIWTLRQRRAAILEMQGLRVVRLRGPRADGLSSLVAAGHLVRSEVKADESLRACVPPSNLFGLLNTEPKAQRQAEKSWLVCGIKDEGASH